MEDDPHCDSGVCKNMWNGMESVREEVERMAHNDMLTVSGEHKGGSNP